MNIRGFIRNFFGFSKAQTNGFLILLPLTLLIIFSNPVYRHFRGKREMDFSREQSILASLKKDFSAQKAKKNSNRAWKEKNELPVAFFKFDPNTASETDLIKLGFKPFLAKRLINYRSKGGKFYKKEDVLHLYGMDSAFFLKIAPFIVVPTQPKASNFTKPKEAHSKEETLAPVDLNFADSAQFVKIKGIGPVLASRIIKYRVRLGGFYSMNQLHEVFGLDSSVVANVRSRFYLPETPMVSRININSISEEELATHPYIKKSVAKAIVAYRFQHGKFQSLSDLEKIRILDSATLQKILPYLTLN